MELLTLNEIIKVINEKMQGVHPGFTEGLILKAVDIDNSQINNLINDLDIKSLDHNFKEIILKYNWGNFACLGLQFGYNDENSLEWLINHNLNYYDFSTLRKNNLIIIANGDPYTVLLDYISGRIYAVDSETYLDSKLPIACNFELFVRALGTGEYSYWNKKQKEFIELMTKISDKDGLLFWRSFVNYYI